ncbi:MAG TPA: MBL fold metallo-hydrolase [Vicinamibacterales bacterium]|nr:MBL fold metallo-hydrolase [Vicinamibacterales bacterium]
MDRRQFLVTGFGAMAGSVIPSVVRAQADRVTVLTAGGTNIVALRDGNSTVLVDSGGTGSEREVSAERVVTLFNTHYHADNTAGNERLRASGAEIVAHVNTKLWMSTPVWIPAEDRYRQPRPAGAQPTKTFYTNGSMTAGGEHIEYGYLIDAHTSGDIYVFFRDANVLAVGDVASPVRDPELDYLTGAWLGGRVDAMTKLLSLADANTRIVPGFGPVMTRAQLQAERDVMKTIYDRAADRIRQGDDANDMLEWGVLKDLPRAWKDPKKFLYDVQKGLWAHHNKINPNVV